jgi:hypothetical protein
LTPFARLLKRLAERLLGTFDEGPEPPARLREMVLMFANDNPQATRLEWVEFAAHLAGEAHRSGFVRGWEMDVRTAEKPWHGEPPELMADLLDPGWPWAPAVLLSPDDVPPEAA